MLTAKEVLGAKFTGTSNAHLAQKYDLEAKGTNAHELPMVLAALAGRNGDDVALRDAQYDVLRQWQNVYRGALLVMLTDSMIPEAQERASGKAGLATVLGFALAMALSLQLQ